MKSLFCFLFLFSSATLSVKGQSYDSSIFFTAEKEDETFCGEMKLISIIQHMSDPYYETHFFVNIGPDLFEVEQTFLGDGNPSIHSVSLSPNEPYSQWDGVYNGEYIDFTVMHDSTSQIEIEDEIIEIQEYTAVSDSMYSVLESFTIHKIIDFGIIPFEELGLLGYTKFNLIGLERNDTYYPIAGDFCGQDSINTPVSPVTPFSTSYHQIQESEFYTYVYNENRTLLSINHSDGCDLEIYNHTIEETRLILSIPDIYNLQLDTDHFYNDNTLAGYFTDDNGVSHIFSLHYINNEYQYFSSQQEGEINGVVSFQSYGSIVFRPGSVTIHDLFGNKLSTFGISKNYANGGLLNTDVYAFYEKNLKTIHLYNKELELIQSLEILFPQIDGFKVINGSFFTWKNNLLKAYNFANGSFHDLDSAADINSIRVQDHQLTWKSIDGTAFKKAYFNNENEITIENQPLIDGFTNPQFAYWDDNTLIIADAHTIDVGDTQVEEISILQAKNAGQLTGYDLRLDSLKINVDDDGQSDPIYTFDIQFSNQGSIPVREILFTTSESDQADCPMPLFEHRFSINTLDSGESYALSFSTTEPMNSNMCFYIHSTSGFADLDFEDNYKCYQGEITHTDDITTNSYTLFPNPTIDELTINNYTGRVNIYDIKGQLIIQKDISRSINVINLNKGIYMLKLENGEVFRFVKW